MVRRSNSTVVQVSRWTVALVLLGFAEGCAKGTPANSTASAPAAGPHGGFAAALPNNQGFAEVVIEADAAGAGAAPRTQVVVYFLAPDLKSALTALPTGVSVRLMFPDKDAETIPLSAQAKADDPTGGGRFASNPGQYFLDEPIGELTATLGGQAFTAAFRSVR